MKKIHQLQITGSAYKRTLPPPPVHKTICTVLLLSAISGFTTAQVSISMLGAMNALNNNYVTTNSAPTPTSPVVLSPARLINPGSNASDILTNKNLSIAYQSAYSWWMGYQDYKGAAQGLSFNADGTQVELGNSAVYLPVSTDLANAVSFFTEDTHFTLFRDFGTYQVTLIIRGNQPIPVELVADPGGYIVYTPQVNSFKTSIPLNLK